MLGEMTTIAGDLNWSKDTALAYAAQRAWLMNATLKENILFGENEDPARFVHTYICFIHVSLNILYTYVTSIVLASVLGPFVRIFSEICFCFKEFNKFVWLILAQAAMLIGLLKHQDHRDWIAIVRKGTRVPN